MRLLMIVFLLSVVLAACAPSGSPRVNINKNVYVLAGGLSECQRDNGEGGCQCAAPNGISVVYFTTSETGVTAQIEQQLKDLLKLKLPY